MSSHCSRLIPGPTRGTARIATAVTAAVLLTAPLPAAAAEPQPVVDWGAKHLHLPDTDPFDLTFTPGDAPFLGVVADGEHRGGIELVTFAPGEHDADPAAWDPWVEDLYDAIARDRREGCDPAYTLDTDPIEHVDVGGRDGIRYGFTGSWPDGRTSERAVFHATVHDGQLSIISTTGYAADGCLERMSELDLDVFPEIEPVADRIAAASVLRDVGVPAARRIGGGDRYVTAVASALASFGGRAPTAVLVSGGSAADALTASHLAGHLGAPVLLTPGAALPPGVADGLDALGVDHVVIVGGSRAVSDAVADAVEASGRTVERIGGADRYATAAAVADRAARDGQGEAIEPQPSAILAGSAIDALAAGPLAFATSMPILLTPADHLHPATAGALDRLGIEHVVVAGGVAAIAPDVERHLREAGYTTERIAGGDRQETAAAFATFALDGHGFQPDHVVLTRGDRLADALVAAAHAGSRRGPVLLTDSPDTLGEAASTWLDQHRGQVATLHLLGGTAALDDSVAAAAVTAAIPVG